ncbi:hypothetical protein WBQ88_16290 [Sphingopyxis sp. CCNWLW253]|uniref:hypothetical protein n=1 Tax=unclassified Sphingopyxis TaxID=2614943 RepID=UPI003012EF64
MRKSFSNFLSPTRIIEAVARRIEADATTHGVHLWVFEANEAALRFYLRLGGEVVERDSSQIPAARGATILRVFWRDIAALSGIRVLKAALREAAAGC